MPLGSLTITHKFAGETGWIIAVPRKTTTPLADVICTIDGVTNQTRIPYAAPHDDQVSLLIEDLEPVWYFIHFYRSADGAALDELLLTIAGNARNGAQFPLTRFEYVVDRGNSEPDVWSDPVSDTIQLRDTRLADKVYFVFERGTGPLMTYELTDRTDAGGGFDLDVPDKVFEPGEEYMVLVMEKVDVDSSTSSGGGSDYNDILLINEDTDYDPVSMNSKVLVANWENNIGLFSIPALAGVANSKFRLQTHGGSQSHVIIQFNEGDTVRFMNDAFNQIILTRGEEIEILFKEGVAYIGFSNTDYKRVGKREDFDASYFNGLMLDGTQYNQVDYPRLMWWINYNGIPTVSESTWASMVVIEGANKFPWKGFYAVEGDTIRVPDMRDMTTKVLKTFDLEDASDPERHKNQPGGYQKDGVGDFSGTATMQHGYSYTGPPNSGTLGNGLNTPEDKDTAIKVTTGKKTRSENIGQLKIVII